MPGIYKDSNKKTEEFNRKKEAKFKKPVISAPPLQFDTNSTLSSVFLLLYLQGALGATSAQNAVNSASKQRRPAKFNTNGSPANWQDTQNEMARRDAARHENRIAHLNRVIQGGDSAFQEKMSDTPGAAHVQPEKGSKAEDISDVKFYRPGERLVSPPLKPGYMNELIHLVNTHQLVEKNQTPEQHEGSWSGAEAASLPKWPMKKMEGKSQLLVRDKRFLHNPLEAQIKHQPEIEERDKLERRRKETVTPKLKKISNTLLNALGEKWITHNQNTTNPGYDDPQSEELFLELESFEREERIIKNLAELTSITLSPEYDPAHFVTNNINFFAEEAKPHVGVVNPNTKVMITVIKSSLPLHNAKDEIDVTWSEYVSGLWLPKYKKDHRSFFSKLTGGDVIKSINIASAKVNGKPLPYYITSAISQLTLSDDFKEDVSSKLNKDENFISGLELTKKYQLMASLSQYYNDNFENPVEREMLENIEGATSKVFSAVYINKDIVNNLVYLGFPDDFGGSLFSLKNVTTPYWHVPADPSGRAVLFTDDDDFMGWFTSHLELKQRAKYLDGESKLSLSQDFKVHMDKQTINDMSKAMALLQLPMAYSDMEVLTNDINKQYRDNLIELKDYFISQLLSVVSGYASSAMYGQVSNFLKRYLMGQSLELTIQNLEGLFKAGSADNIEERNDAIMGILMGGMINAGMPIAIKGSEVVTKRGGQVVAEMGGKMKKALKDYKSDAAELKASVKVKPSLSVESDNSFGRNYDFDYIDADAGTTSLASYRHVLQDANTDIEHLALTKKFLNKIQTYKENDKYADEFNEGIKSYRFVDLSTVPDYSKASSDIEVMQRFLTAEGLTPRQLGALSQMAMIKVEANSIKKSLDVFYKYQKILKPGSKKILALPQVFMLTASHEGSQGRCLPLVYSMAAALQRGQERNLVDNLYLGMTDDENYNWIIKSLSTLHTTSKVNPSLANIGKNTVKNILEKLDLADDNYFTVETSTHAMLVAKVTSPQSSIPKFIFYDPNLGVFIYETRSAFKDALDKTLGSPQFFNVYKAFGTSSYPEYNLRKIDAKLIGEVKIHGDDTVADFSRSGARDGSSTANQQAKDYTQLAENFHHGDIIYGLDAPRKLALERLEEYGFAKHITPKKNHPPSVFSIERKTKYTHTK